MKNVFNWTVGSFFRTFGRIIAYIVIGSLVAFLLTRSEFDLTNLFMPKLNAATLTSYNTYERIMNEETGCGTSNRYSYTTYANNDIAGDLYNIGSFNTQYSGKAAFLGFNFQYNLIAGKYYDIEVNFNTSDLSDALNTTNVYVDSGTSCQDTSGDRVSLIGFTLSHSGTNYSNKATIRIMANSATTYWGFYFYKGPTQFVTGVNNWRVNSITINEVDPSNTNIIIDNATNNTTNIINNNNENTQQIINNQNENMNTCTTNKTITDFIQGSISGASGGAFDSDTRIRTTWISVNNNSQYKVSYNTSNLILLAVFEYSDRSSDYYIQRTTNWTNNPFTFTTQSNTKYIRLAFRYDDDSIITPSDLSSVLIEGQFCFNKLDETNNNLSNINDSINDDDTSSAQSQASSFFSNFTTNTHGLTSIITAPLSAIQSITSATCSPLVLPIPFVNQNLTLPCMREIYVSNFGGFMTLYDTITFGIIAYWVLVRIFALVKDFKNPEHDEIEVMDL